MTVGIDMTDVVLTAAPQLVVTTCSCDAAIGIARYPSMRLPCGSYNGDSDALARSRVPANSIS